MDIAFDRSGIDGGGVPGCPDWHGLRARLCAARAAHLALKDQAGARAGLLAAVTEAGSFDRVSARVLGGLGMPLGKVNPDSWANRKPGGTRNIYAAGETSLGERGII